MRHIIYAAIEGLAETTLGKKFQNLFTMKVLNILLQCYSIINNKKEDGDYIVANA